VIPTPLLILILGVTPFPANIFTLPLSRAIFVFVLLLVYLLIVSVYTSPEAVNIPTLILFVVDPPLPVTLSKVSLSDPALTEPDAVYEITSTDSPPNNASFKTILVPFDAT
jgi:hypothetical protein